MRPANAYPGYGQAYACYGSVQPSIYGTQGAMRPPAPTGLYGPPAMPTAAYTGYAGLSGASGYAAPAPNPFAMRQMSTAVAQAAVPRAPLRPEANPFVPARSAPYQGQKNMDSFIGGIVNMKIDDDAPDLDPTMFTGNTRIHAGTATRQASSYGDVLLEDIAVKAADLATRCFSGTNAIQGISTRPRAVVPLFAPTAGGAGTYDYMNNSTTYRVPNAGTGASSGQTRILTKHRGTASASGPVSAAYVPP